MNLRWLIVEWSRSNTSTGNGRWLLDVYHHLLAEGASPEDAIKAISSFVDEIIATKARQRARGEQ
ncbi:hypothetical protein [Bradyrhizobium sp. USDA 10063]